MSAQSPSSTSHVFGPVPSRRLGRSLGLDIIPHKTCTFDCVYCQVGRTTERTVEQAVHVPRARVVEEVRCKLEGGASPDVITLAGSGEPTLHVELGEIISDIKQFTSVPVVVLTNGSLFHDRGVRSACCKADIVLPSLDAGDEDTYRQINRPHESVSFDTLVEGLVAFRKEFSGQIWLEVFFLEGINTDADQVQRIRAIVDRIQPDKVHLNTAVRPTAEACATRVSEPQLREIANQLGPNAEVVADYSHVHDQSEFKAQRNDVLDMLKRRPCSLDDIASGLGMHPNHVLKFIEELTGNSSIREENRDGVRYYVATGS